MADPMERILAIAVVQADENVALGNALVAAERMIADLRNQIVEATYNLEGIRRTFAYVEGGYQHTVAEMREELVMSRARLDSAVRLRGESERAVEQ